MKTFGRGQPVVESVASAAGSVRRQRDEGIALLDQKGAKVSAWLDEMFKLYKAQLAEVIPCEDEDISVSAGLELQDSLPKDVVAWIDTLRKKDLVVELRGRSLPTTGLKDELRQRLIEAMLAERSEETDSKNKQQQEEEPVEKVAQHMKSMDISIEKSLPVVVAATTVEPKSADDEEMEDIGAIANEETSDPMETELLEQPTIPMLEQPTIHMPKKAESDIIEVPKPTGIANDRTAIDTENEKSNFKVDTMKPTLEPAQPKSPVRTSRSPLKRMQSGVSSALKNRMQSTVQSALRNLRPVSPKKISVEAKKSPAKSTKKIVVLPEAVSTDETESSNSSQSEAGIPSHAAPPVPVVPVPGSASIFKTPATTASATTGKFGGLGIHSDKVKESNNARMARLAEMRTKSKAFPSSSSTKGVHAMPAFGAFKASSSAMKTGTNDSKRQLLANQMREKARLGEAATASTSVAPSHAEAPFQQFTKPLFTKQSSTVAPASVASGKYAPTQKTLASKSPNGSSTRSLKTGTTPPPSKQARSPVLSPLDTYEMSDHGGSSDTDEEEERARRVGKRIPNWARQKNLAKSLTRQYTDRSIDPDDLFGEVNTCSLEAIFSGRKHKFRKRTSSGNWTRDKATAAEKLAFKRQMGYVVKA